MLSLLLNISTCIQCSAAVHRATGAHLSGVYVYCAHLRIHSLGDQVSGCCPGRREVCGLTALVLARRQRWRRKSEALHLRRLWQQWPSSRLRGHIVLCVQEAGRGRQSEFRHDCCEQRGRRLSTKSMRLCAVVGGQPMEATRDDGPKKSRSVADRRDCEAAKTKQQEGRIGTVQCYSGCEISASRGVVRLYGRSGQTGQKVHRDGRWRRGLACRGFEDALAAGSQRGSRAQRWRCSEWIS